MPPLSPSVAAAAAREDPRYINGDADSGRPTHPVSTERVDDEAALASDDLPASPVHQVAPTKEGQASTPPSSLAKRKQETPDVRRSKRSKALLPIDDTVQEPPPLDPESVTHYEEPIDHAVQEPPPLDPESVTHYEEPIDHAVQEPPPLDPESVTHYEELRLEILETAMSAPKRSRSRHPSNAELSEDATGSSRSRLHISPGNYRLVLFDWRIRFQHEAIDQSVKRTVDRILHLKDAHNESHDLKKTVKDFCAGFVSVLTNAGQEGRTLSLLERALEGMYESTGKVLETADRDVDLNPDILPEIHHTTHSLQPGERAAYEAHASEAANDQAQPVGPMSGLHNTPGGGANAPVTPNSDMGPPPIPVNAQRLKTPRPDLLVSFIGKAFAGELLKKGVNERHKDEVLGELGRHFTLVSSPTASTSAIFPSMAVEGKSYATGATLFEAENQAAVSGAYMLYLQMELARLADRYDANPARPRVPRRRPLAFSICLQGPVICLWAHYVVYKGDIPDFTMRIVAQCHASLEDSVMSFMTALYGVVKWSSTELFNDIVAQVFRLWTARQREVGNSRV